MGARDDVKGRGPGRTSRDMHAKKKKKKAIAQWASGIVQGVSVQQ